MALGINAAFGLLISAAFECRIAAALRDSLITYAWVTLSGALPGIPALIGLVAARFDSRMLDGERLPLHAALKQQ